MIVYRPLNVTESILASSTIQETNPTTIYPAGAPFITGNLTSIDAGLGEIRIYRCAANATDNGTNPPATSPTIWDYQYSIYEEYSSTKEYGLNHKVTDLAAHSVYTSVVENNYARPLDPVANPVWANIGTTDLVLPTIYDNSVTYTLGQQVYATFTITDLEGTTRVRSDGVFTNTNASVIGINPFSLVGGNPWVRALEYPTPYITDAIYNSGRVVKDASNNIYKALEYTQGYPLNNPVSWVRTGATNRWSAFDTETSTQSNAVGYLQYSVSAGMVDTVILMNVIAERAKISVIETSPTTSVLYEETRDILTAANSSTITDWWEYFNANFDVLSSSTNVLFTNLPMSATAYIQVELFTDVNTSSATLVTEPNIFLGDLIFSRARELSITGYGLQAGIRDFSVVTDDGFGGQFFNKRRNRRRMISREYITHDQFNRTFRILSDLTATPCVWLASSDEYLDQIDYLYEGLLIKAWYKDFTVEVPGYNEIYTSFELEGLF